MVNNSIVKKSIADKECKFMAGTAEVTLTPTTVKNYLVSGNANDVTAQEVVMFINLCKYQGLNPFLREAYLVKYGSQPASLIVGKSAFESRAEANTKYRGCESGVVVTHENGIEYREGTLVLEGEKLVGGWARVHVEGYERPIYTSVSLSEYTTGKALWSSKPATMIRKVAKVQALREAFPSNFKGMYVEEEMRVDVPLPETPIETQVTQSVEVIEEPEILSGADLL